MVDTWGPLEEYPRDEFGEGIVSVALRVIKMLERYKADRPEVMSNYIHLSDKEADEIMELLKFAYAPNSCSDPPASASAIMGQGETPAAASAKLPRKYEDEQAIVRKIIDEHNARLNADTERTINLLGNLSTPEGWTLLPLEPTEAMLEAGGCVFPGSDPTYCNAGAKDVWIDRLGAQYGARQTAALRGDARAVDTADFWMKQIAEGHWHEILAALRRPPLSEEQSHGTTVKP